MMEDAKWGSEKAEIQKRGMGKKSNEVLGRNRRPTQTRFHTSQKSHAHYQRLTLAVPANPAHHLQPQSYFGGERSKKGKNKRESMSTWMDGAIKDDWPVPHFAAAIFASSEDVIVLHVWQDEQDHSKNTKRESSTRVVEMLRAGHVLSVYVSLSEKQMCGFVSDTTICLPFEDVFFGRMCRLPSCQVFSRGLSV